LDLYAFTRDSPYNFTQDWVTSSPSSFALLTVGSSVITSYNTLLTSYQVSSSGQQWSAGLGIGIVATPSISVDGVIYVTGYSGVMAAFDAGTGDRIWLQSYLLTYGTPAVGYNGKLYAMSTNGTLGAFSAVNGDLEWTVDIFQQMPVFSPTVGPDGMVYVPLDATVYAVDPNTHSIVWSYVTKAPIGAQLALGNGGTLYALSLDGNVYGLTTSTGRLIWGSVLAIQRPGGLAVDAAERVFVASSGILFALDGRSQSTLWSVNLGMDCSATAAWLALGDGFAAAFCGSTLSFVV
jgi:outer membrane protein assembly factor BamB